MNSVLGDDLRDSRVVEDVSVPSKITIIINDISIGSDTSILDEGHASYKGTSEVVDAMVKSSIPLTVNTHVHDTSNSAPGLVDSSVSNQIYRYSFVTPLIEDKIKHEIIDSSIITSSRPSGFPRDDYVFMVVPIKSSSSESSEFLAMIRRVLSSDFLLVI